MMRRDPFGFTVIEMLITLLVIGIVFGAFSSVFVSIQTINKRGIDVASANTLAFSKLQEYENKDFSTLPSTAITNPVTTVTAETFTSSLPTSLPSPKSATVYAASISSTLKQITVRVTYGQNSGTQCTSLERCVEYVTLIQQHGVGR